MNTLYALLAIASQHDPDFVGPPSSLAGDPVLWPYLVAIATLATAVTALWVAYVKNNAAHGAKLESVHAEYRKADEEKSKRTAEEHGKKDAALLDVSVKTADVLARVEGAIRESTEAMKSVQKDIGELLRAQSQG